MSTYTNTTGTGPGSVYTPPPPRYEFIRTDADVVRAWDTFELFEILKSAGYRSKAREFVLEIETLLQRGETAVARFHRDLADDLGMGKDFVVNRVREIKQQSKHALLVSVSGGNTRRRGRDEVVPEGVRIVKTDLGDMLNFPTMIDLRPLYEHRRKVAAEAVRLLFEDGRYGDGTWDGMKWDVPQHDRERFWRDAILMVPLPAPAPKIERKKTTTKATEPTYSKTAILREIGATLGDNPKIDNRDAAVATVAAWAVTQLSPEAVQVLFARVMGSDVEITSEGHEDPEAAIHPEFHGCSSLLGVETTSELEDASSLTEEEDSGASPELHRELCDADVRGGPLKLKDEQSSSERSEEEPLGELEAVSTPVNSPLPVRHRAVRSSLTVAEFAEHVGLPEEFMRGVGVTEWRDDWGREFVAVPYFDEGGGLQAIKQRVRLVGRPKYIWTEGTGHLFGLDRLKDARRRPALPLVEGETDAMTLWYCGLPALGVSGADNYKAIRAAHVEGIASIIVVRDDDSAGLTFASNVAEHLAGLGYRGGVYVMGFDQAKDANGLLKILGGDREAFRREFDDAFRRADDFRLT